MRNPSMTTPATAHTPVAGQPARPLPEAVSPPPSTGGSLAKTSVASSACVMLGAAIAFGTTVLVSNAAGDRGAGIFFQIVAFFTIATTMCTFGADTALVRFLSARAALGDSGSIPTLLRVAMVPVLTVAAAFTFALWLAAPSIQGLLGADAIGVEAALRLAAPFIVLSATLGAVFGALRGLGRIVSFTLLQNTVLPLLRLGSIAIAIVLGANIVNMAAAWAVPVAVVLIVAIAILRRGIRTTSRIEGRLAGPAPRPAAARKSTLRRGTAGGFWSFASARGVSSMVEILLEWIDVIAVAVFLGPAQAGVYGVVTRCVRMGVMIEHTGRIVTGTALSAALALNNHERVQFLFTSLTRILVLGAWPFYLLLILFGPPILSVFGQEFRAGAPALMIISAAMMLAVSAGGVQSMLLMGGRSRWQMMNKFAALTVALTLNLTLVPVMGITGAAIAWAAAVLVDSGLAAAQVAFAMKVRSSAQDLFVPMALAAGIFGAGAMLVRLLVGPTVLGLLIAGGAGAALYLVLLISLRRRLHLEAVLTMRRPSPRPDPARDLTHRMN